uniref:DUF2726 domain-containing protein n=1 Tax=Marinobacterium profundum TaxID=1714300 RepID=UPI00083405B7|nr:DUF2726 domain-containing protein [Marinobacterium profundum]
MQWFNWPVLVALVVLAVVIFLLRRRRVPADEYIGSYELGERLLNDEQCRFLEVLEQAVGTDHRVLARIALADVVTVDETLEGAALDAAMAGLEGRQFSFLVCTRAALEPVCAVELDAPSLRRAKMARRDLQLDVICEQAGLPLLRVPAQASYQVAEIGLQFDALFEPPVQALAPAQQRAESEPVFESIIAGALSLSARHDRSAADSFAASSAQSMECPRCAAPMVLQRAPKGAAPDKAYWACSLAPSCRQRMPLQIERNEEPLSQRLEGLVP